MAANKHSTVTLADVPSIDVDEFERKIHQARQLGLTLSLSHDVLDDMDTGDVTVVLSVLSDLLEEIEAMSRPVVDGVVLFKRQLAGKEAVHG
jgi:hypothetical protein